MKLRPWFLMAILVMVGIMVGGCGYAYYSETNYFYPDWTPDGNIICIKEVVRLKESMGGPYPGHSSTSAISTRYYITLMNADGSNEQDIKEIQIIGFVNASPKGSYLAYTQGNTLVITYMNGNEYKSFNCANTISAIDWSPEEDRIVYSTNNSTWETSILELSTGAIKRIANGISPTWSYDGKRIVYNSYYYVSNQPVWDGLYSYLVSNEALVKITSGEGNNPDFLSDNISVIYDSGNNYNIKICNTDTGSSINLMNEAVYFPKYSPANSGILFGKGATPGIWMSGIDGRGLLKMK